MKIDVGIVNYNGGEHLLRCVRSLLAMEDSAVQIWVLDNASTDGSLQKLRQANLPVQIIASAQNLGYAGAFNKLNEHFSAEGCTVANMDLVFDSRWSRAVRSSLATQKDYSALASLILHEDGATINATGIVFEADLHPHNQNFGRAAQGDNMRSKEVFGCYGAVITYRRSALEAVGPMESSFFLFYEETEWFWRLQLAGLKTLFSPQPVVYHARSLVTVKGSLLKLYYPERNRMRTLLRLVPFWYLPWAVLYSIKRMIQGSKSPQFKSLNQQSHSKFKLASTVLRAWLAALKYLPSDLRWRRQFFRQFPAARGQTLAILRKYLR